MSNERVFPGTPQLRLLAACLQAKVPPYLNGQPGIGKSSLFSAITRSWGWYTDSMSGANRDASDFLGLPEFDDEGVLYAAFRWVNRANAADRSVVFIDEIASANADTRAAMQRVLQERMAGEVALDDHVSLAAAGNPADIATNGSILEGPVANRFVHIEWEPDFDTWSAGLMLGFDNLVLPPVDELAPGGHDDDRIAAAMIVDSFLRSNRHLWNPGQPDDIELASKGWPSPRSWHNLVRVLTWLDAGDSLAVRLAVEGAVGAEVVPAFMAHHADRALPSTHEVLASPDKVQWRTYRSDQAYTIAYSVAAVGAYAGRNGDVRGWEQAAVALGYCAEGGVRDVAAAALRHLNRDRPLAAKLDRDTTARLSSILRDLGRLAPTQATTDTPSRIA